MRGVLSCFASGNDCITINLQLESLLGRLIWSLYRDLLIEANFSPRSAYSLSQKVQKTTTMEKRLGEGIHQPNKFGIWGLHTDIASHAERIRNLVRRQLSDFNKLTEKTLILAFLKSCFGSGILWVIWDVFSSDISRKISGISVWGQLSP